MMLEYVTNISSPVVSRVIASPEGATDINIVGLEGSARSTPVFFSTDQAKLNVSRVNRADVLRSDVAADIRHDEIATGMQLKEIKKVKMVNSTTGKSTWWITGVCWRNCVLEKPKYELENQTWKRHDEI